MEWYIIEDEYGEYCFSYVNDLVFNDSNVDVCVNMLYYEWIGNDGKV